MLANGNSLSVLHNLLLPCLSFIGPKSCPQQLEVQELGLGLASRLPSGLKGGGGDKGDSNDKAETCASGGAGAATWTGDAVVGAVVTDAAGDSGSTAPPPLLSLASLSRSSWTRAACWALRVAERCAGRALKPAVSCSTRCSRDSICRSKSSLRSLSSDMSSYMTLCICGMRHGNISVQQRSFGDPNYTSIPNLSFLWPNVVIKTKKKLAKDDAAWTKQRKRYCKSNAFIFKNVFSLIHCWRFHLRTDILSCCH